LPAFPSNCPCTPAARVEDRNVGGFHDTIVNVPYVVSIQWNNYPFAVGTLVDETTVVTSAHAFKYEVCSFRSHYKNLTNLTLLRNVLPEDLPFYSIRAGSSNSLTGGQVVNVASVYRHPDYVLYPPKNDIAVIKLEGPIIFGDVKAAKLPERDFEIKHISASCKFFVWVTFSGWGSLDYKSQPCDLLQTSFLPLVDDSICESLYGALFDGTKELCATEEARASCKGDSGSGLVLDDILVGVATFTPECPDKKTPAKYLKVTGYLDFIMQYMEDNQSINSS